MNKKDALGEFIRRAPKPPSMQAVLNTLQAHSAGEDPIAPEEYQKLLVAKGLETGLQTHLLLQALGYDDGLDQGSAQMGILHQRYGLPNVYQQLSVAGKPLAKDEAEANAMADQFFQETKRHARLFADQLQERHR